MTSDRNPISRLLRWAWGDITSGETIDLWLLISAALGFTVLGAIGIAKTQVLSSVVLGLLALLAISQIRGRKEARDLILSWSRSRTAIFETDFPAAYYAARVQSGYSYAFAGMTMGRTLPTMKADLVRILDNRGVVRILLPDPSKPELLEMVAASKRYGGSPSDLGDAIRQSIAVARSLRGQHGTEVEVRVTSMLPRIGLNLIDVERPSGSLMVQMYQTGPSAEAAPIFILNRADTPWFDHFCREFDQVWDHGTPFARGG